MIEIQLTQGKTALVDDEFSWLANEFTWHAMRSTFNNHWYAGSARPNGRLIKMHRIIMELDDDDEREVHHKDNNGLNNQRSNLEIVDASSHRQLDVKRNGASSQYKGVHWLRAEKKWIARITKFGETKYIGRFNDEVEAAKAYDRAALEIYGAGAYVNFHPEDEEN